MDQLCGAGFGGDFVGMDAVEKGSRRRRAIGVLIGQGRAVMLGVPALAGDHAGMTADTGIKIDHKAKLAVRMGRKAGHLRTLRQVVTKSARSPAKRSGSSRKGAWPMSR